MPLDPNIITYGLRQMPGVDINAMVQQQITGMENINELERQRQADALALQDRERKLSSENEAAAVKALLPAYTYGIQTGDIVGAGNLAPPEMRGKLQPFIDALTGKSPQEVQAALIGSLASSGEVGQEALAAIQRAQTAQIQQGQLDVSREDIKLRRQKQALDARGEGAWELKEGVDENGDLAFVWINPRTRQMIQADFTGGGVPAAAPGAVPSAVPGAAPGTSPIPAPLPSTDLVTPRQLAPGAPQVAPPISVEQPPAEQPGPQFKPKPKAAASEKLGEQEAKSMELAGQLAQANQITAELEAKGVRTSDAFVSFINGLFSSLPDAAGRNAADQLTALTENLLPNSLLTPDERRLARAQIQFVDAILRSRSGAEIKTSEFPSMYRVFFPTEADEGVPEIVNDKRIAREVAVELMKGKAGPKGAETVDRLLREKGVLAPAGTPLTPGATVDGIEFLGAEPEE